MIILSCNRPVRGPLSREAKQDRPYGREYIGFPDKPEDLSLLQFFMNMFVNLAKDDTHTSFLELTNHFLKHIYRRNIDKWHIL